MNKYKEYWENHFTIPNPDDISYCSWLDQYSVLINNTDDYIIDLGCGTESKIKYLLERGKKVLACDYADLAINLAKERFKDSVESGKLILKQFDMTYPFQIDENYTDLIIADLSLHYFNKSTTIDILKEIKRVLKPNGNLLFRVNSVKDESYNPNLDKKIEHNFYFAKGYEKRFFDMEDIRYFFQDFKIEDVQEETIIRYGKSKVLFIGNVKNKK